MSQMGDKNNELQSIIEFITSCKSGAVASGDTEPYTPNIDSYDVVFTSLNSISLETVKNDAPSIVNDYIESESLLNRDLPSYVEEVSNTIMPLLESWEKDHVAGGKSEIRKKLTVILNCFTPRSFDDSSGSSTRGLSESVKYLKKKAKETSKKSEKKLMEFEDKLFGIKDTIILLTVTVLGIFCSITFALSGSLNILNNALDTSKYSIFEVMLRCSVLGLFVVNIVFLLMYAISKLIGRSLAMNCTEHSNFKQCIECYRQISGGKAKNKTTENNCATCKQNNSPCACCDGKILFNKTICKLLRKFSYISWANGVLILLLAISITCGLHFDGLTIKAPDFSQQSTSQATAMPSTTPDPNSTPIPTSVGGQTATP